MDRPDLKDSTMDEPEENGGFRVTDKRRFSPEGESRQEEETPQKDQSEQQATTEAASEFDDAAKTASSADVGGEQTEALPPLDFSTFVLSMANTALFQLGLVRVPEQNESVKDLQGARQTIDLIALLEEKTRGNLTDQESKILTETLYQLRMAFVEASKSG